MPRAPITVSRLPLPVPTALRVIAPKWRILAPGTSIWRIYRAEGAHPQAWNTFRTWGPVRAARFDHHERPSHEQERGVLYAAAAFTTCVAEVFQLIGIIARHEDAPYAASFTVTDPVWLLDLRGTWPTIAGASMALNSSVDHERTQAWSRAIYEAYPSAHGLWYASAMHANAPSILLYERARPLLAAYPAFNMPLADPALHLTLQTAADGLGYVLD